MSKKACPQCGRQIHLVKRSPDSPLNQDQFDAVKAGDYYCDHCPSNDRGHKPYCYWWESELIITPAAEIMAIDVDKVRELCQADNRDWGVIVTGTSQNTRFVTWGKSAEDKVMAVEISDELRSVVIDRTESKGQVFESFVLDAARIKEQHDGLLEACKAVVEESEDTFWSESEFSETWKAILAQLRAAIAKATMREKG